MHKQVLDLNIMQELNQILMANISQYGYWAVFTLMTLESVLIPIPSEITMAFAGFLSGIGILNFWLVVFLGALGNLVGSLIAFWLGKRIGEKWIRSLIKKYGKWFLIHESGFDKSTLWFKKYGQSIAFWSRLLPIIRTFISLPAGISGMSISVFSFYTFVGSFIWSLFLAYLGLKLGQNWQVVEPYFREVQFLVIGICVVGVIFHIYLNLRKK